MNCGSVICGSYPCWVSVFQEKPPSPREGSGRLPQSAKADSSLREGALGWFISFGVRFDSPKTFPQKSLPLRGRWHGGCRDGGRGLFSLILVENVPLERFQGFTVLAHRERESGLVRSPSKSFGFLTLFAARMSIARSVSLSADSDKGLLAP